MTEDAPATVRNSAISIVVILLARAMRSARHARAIVEGIDLARPPHSWADGIYLRAMIAMRPALEAHGGDWLAMRKAMPEHLLYAFDLADALTPETIARAQRTPDLIEVVNIGRAPAWKLPAAPAAQVKLSKRRYSAIDHALEHSSGTAA